MGSGLILSSKKQVAKLKTQKGGKGLPFFTPTYSPKGYATAFICPIKNEDSLIITKVKVHEAYNGKQQRVAGPVVSPDVFGEKDVIVETGWKLKDKHKDHKNPKVKELFKKFLPRTKNICFVIDPNDPEKGIQQWTMPAGIAEFVLGTVEGEDEGSEGDMSFAHPTEGKLIKWRKKGEKLDTEYTNIQWVDIPEDGLGDITVKKLVELLKDVPDVIGQMFKKPNKDQIADYQEYLDGVCEKFGVTVNWKNVKSSNLEVDDDADVDDEDSDSDEDESPKSKKRKPAIDDDDADEDEDLDLDEDEDEDEEETPKSKKKPTSKKKPADDEDDDADLDEDDEDESPKSKKKPTSKKKPVDDEDEDADLDEDEEDEKPKSKKKPVSKKKPKPSDDDDDDTDLDDDDADEDEDEELDLDSDDEDED